MIPRTRSIQSLLNRTSRSHFSRKILLKHHHKTKLAAKIEKDDRKKGKKSGGSGFDQAGAPFHEGILPSQYNLQESELERVGRVKRRKEW